MTPPSGMPPPRHSPTASPGRRRGSRSCGRNPPGCRNVPRAVDRRDGGARRADRRHGNATRPDPGPCRGRDGHRRAVRGFAVTGSRRLPRRRRGCATSDRDRDRAGRRGGLGAEGDRGCRRRRIRRRGCRRRRGQRCRSDRRDGGLAAGRAGPAGRGSSRCSTEPETAAAALLGPVDPAEAEAADLAAKTAAKAAVGVSADAQRRLQDLDRLAGQLAAEVQALAPAQAQHDELAGLADVIEGRGQNARKMSLRSYVLAARLEEVAVAASARLRRMSAGRYEFVHSDEAGTRRPPRRAGTRHPRRLHRRRCGRRRRSPAASRSSRRCRSPSASPTSWPPSPAAWCSTRCSSTRASAPSTPTPSTSVMGVLDELREGGRVVGIVSHVDEMRQRIPSRLHVMRAGPGPRSR